MMSNIRVIWDTLRLQMKNSFVRPMFRFCLIINPVANTVIIYEMFRNSGQDNFGTYVILGAGLMAIWSCICFSSAGDISRERWHGTLAMIFVAPAGFQLIIFGKILGNTLLSLLTDSMHLILNTMCYVLMIFCGANFPITQLPIWGQFISRILPLTRGIEAGNLLFEGFNQGWFVRLMIGEFVIGMVFFAASYWVIKYAEKAAIKRASLEMF